jgi:hypothetical protein
LGPDKKYWDIYVDPLLELNNLQDESLVIENQYQNTHFKPEKTMKLLYPDYMLLELLFQKVLIRRFLYNQEIEKYFLDIQKKILNEFKVSINVASLAQNYAASFKFRCRQYRKLLKKINPNILFIVVGYGKEALIRAAKDLKIPVVELQHGVITKYHIGYDVGDGEKQNFADYLFTFGPAWSEMANYPISKHRIIPIGYQYLNNAAEKLDNVEKLDQILFISQGIIGDRLSKFAVDVANIAPEAIKIIFKLHPGEYLRWEKEYSELSQAQKNGSIQVIAGDLPSLYELMAESKWQVGVNSTALFEGMMFKCKTYVVDLPGHEYMEQLIESGDFHLISTPGEISFDYDKNDINYQTEQYFSKNTKERFEKAVHFVIEDYLS